MFCAPALQIAEPLKKWNRSLPDTGHASATRQYGNGIFGTRNYVAAKVTMRSGNTLSLIRCVPGSFLGLRIGHTKGSLTSFVGDKNRHFPSLEGWAKPALSLSNASRPKK